MNTATTKWAVKAALAGALALLLATPSFGQSRDQGRRDDGNSSSERSSNRTYRENERVTAEGHVRSFSRERGGYRVQLDSGRYSYWVPQSYFGNRNRSLSAGLSIRLGGVFRRGAIYVDAVSWPGDRGNSRSSGYDDGSLTGIVDRVDLRNDTVWLRDDRGGELVAVEMPDTGRGRGNDLRDLRRGDHVELSGQWLRGGVFAAGRIGTIRSGRY